MNKFVLNLLECQVTLYPANADGSANLASPIYTGALAENLAVKEKWIESETRPTGAQYPRKHPLIQQYEISIGKVWELSILNAEGGPAGFSTAPQYYVLDVIWTDGDSGDWHRETFYNVTISSRNLGSRDMAGGFTDELVFDAEYKAAPTGGLGAIPVITTALPYLVVWVGPDGTFPLYSYNPANQNFTALADTDTRATIFYDPPDKSGGFGVVFGDPDTQPTVLGQSGPSDGHDGVELGDLSDQPPDDSITPRLDFYYGALRVASVDADGVLYATAFMDGGPTAGTGKFQMYADGALLLTFAAAGAQAWFFDADLVPR